MKQGPQLEFDTHRLASQKENWKVPLQYLSCQIYIKRYQEETCNFIQKIMKYSLSFYKSILKKSFSLTKRAYPDQLQNDIIQALEILLLHVKHVTKIQYHH